MEDGPNYDRNVKNFKGGTPEEFCMHMTVVQEVTEKLGYHKAFTRCGGGVWVDQDGKEGTQDDLEEEKWEKMHAFFVSTIGGTARVQYEQVYHGLASQDYNARHCYRTSVNSLSKEYFQHSSEAGKIQKRYLREGGLWFCGEYSSPRKFHARLEQINN